jgi:hypothetical protein
MWKIPGCHRLLCLRLKTIEVRHLLLACMILVCLLVSMVVEFDIICVARDVLIGCEGEIIDEGGTTGSDGFGGL